MSLQPHNFHYFNETSNRRAFKADQNFQFKPFLTIVNLLSDRKLLLM